MGALSLSLGHLLVRGRVDLLTALARLAAALTTGSGASTSSRSRKGGVCAKDCLQIGSVKCTVRRLASNTCRGPQRNVQPRANLADLVDVP